MVELIKPVKICRGKTYVGKSGLMRKVTRFKVCGVDGTGLIGDVSYIPIKRDGKEGKVKSCYSGDFARWVVREVGAQEDTRSKTMEI